MFNFSLLTLVFVLMLSALVCDTPDNKKSLETTFVSIHIQFSDYRPIMVDVESDPWPYGWDEHDVSEYLASLANTAPSLTVNRRPTSSIHRPGTVQFLVAREECKKVRSIPPPGVKGRETPL